MQLCGFSVPPASSSCISHDISQAISPRAARGLLPYEILEIVNRELSLPRFVTECTPAYISTIRTFLNDHVVHRLATVRKSRGMFEALERSEEWDEDTDLSMGATGKWSYFSITTLLRLSCHLEADKAIVDNKAKVTEDQLSVFLNICWTKYVKAKIEPGNFFWQTTFHSSAYTNKGRPLALLALNQLASRGPR
jgi:DNA-directed RNA polymerase III subunit RPC1